MLEAAENLHFGKKECLYKVLINPRILQTHDMWVVGFVRKPPNAANAAFVPSVKVAT